LRVFELSYGKPAETVELDLDVVDLFMSLR
jgi:hypothetical protein